LSAATETAKRALREKQLARRREEERHSVAELHHPPKKVSASESAAEDEAKQREVEPAAQRSQGARPYPFALAFCAAEQPVGQAADCQLSA